MHFKESFLGTVMHAIISWSLWKALGCAGNWRDGVSPCAAHILVT